MLRKALWRALAEAEARRRARAAPPPPSGLTAAGLALWDEWSREFDAEPEGPRKETMRVALQVLDAETVAIAARVRSGG
jgi:hypothetical protein